MILPGEQSQGPFWRDQTMSGEIKHCPGRDQTISGEVKQCLERQVNVWIFHDPSMRDYPAVVILSRTLQPGCKSVTVD